MNEIQIFQNKNFGQIRTIIINDEVWFVGIDVSEALGYKDTSQAIRKHIDEEDKLMRQFNWSGQNREMWFLTEDGLYEVLMQSRKPQAKAFKKEVKKILKEIRKTGTYTTKQPKEELEELKIRAQLERAEAMKLNAKTRMFNTIMKTTNNKVLSPVAVEVFGLKAIEQITGIDMGQHLPQVPKTYSATEIGKMLGVSAKRIGGLAKNHNLKTEENGIWVMDKSKSSSKEVSTFRYFENAINIFKCLLA